ncbi:pituitary-specific positive transcription factor 1 isoform X1 [Lates japonicus]
MACQAFSTDSFTPLAGDSALPILMHHASTSDCLPATSHAHSMVSTVSSGLSLGQTSKRSHMHLPTSSLSTALGNSPPKPTLPSHPLSLQQPAGHLWHDGSSGDALCQHFSDSYPADLWCPSP